MYPASKKKADVDQFFGLLANSGGYTHLLEYLSACMTEEEHALHNYAIAALTDPSLGTIGQKQLGRYEFVKELYEFMMRFNKK